MMADSKNLNLEVWIDVGFIDKEPVKVGYLNVHPRIPLLEPQVKRWVKREV